MSYTVSGSPGDWLLDLSVTNNLGQFGGPGQTIYYFSIALPSTDITKSPPNWGYAAGDILSFGTGTSYNNPWCINACGNIDITLGIETGQTLSGFQALDTALIEPASLDWVAFSEALTPQNHPGAPYTGPGCVPETCSWNPTFVGTAETPLPATLPLFASGLGAMGLFGWRRKRKTQAVA